MRSAVRLLAIPILFATVPLFAQETAKATSTSADSIAVAKVVAEFHHALSSGDSSAVLRLLAQDAVILESGDVESRAEYRSHHLQADIEFAKAVPSTPAPLQVTVRGNVAWTATTNTTKGEFKGRAIDSTGAESMVLTKEAAGWRIRSIHWSSRRRTTSK